MSEVVYLFSGRQVGPAKVTLSPGAALDLERAEQFLLSLDGEVLTADGPRTAYLLGLAEGHIANLIERFRQVTR